VSFKVTDFGTSRKHIYDFLLVINSNVHPILHLAPFPSYGRLFSKLWLATGVAQLQRPRWGWFPANIAINDMSLKLDYLGCRKYRRIFNHFYVIEPKRYRIRWNNATWGPLRRSRSFKVTDFGTNRELICDFLWVINTKLPPILHRFPVMANYWSSFR